MHVVLMTRGIQRQVKEFEHVMNAQRFPWKRTNIKTGLEESYTVQGALRPIQFWEYVFPEECLTDILGGLGIKGPIQRKELKAIAWMLRKTLNLEQIPTIDGTVTGYRPNGTVNGQPMQSLPVHDLYIPGVAVYPVGIKKDATQDADWDANNEYKQEML